MEFVNNFFPFGVGGVGGHMVKQCLNFGTPLVFRLGKGMLHIISSNLGGAGIIVASYSPEMLNQEKLVYDSCIDFLKALQENQTEVIHDVGQLIKCLVVRYVQLFDRTL